MAWADALVWQHVLSSTRTRADDRVRDRLHHIHEVPPRVDFIAWAWWGRPVATWPEP